MSSDYSSLKVVDLKRELKTRGLSTAGNKDELVERLNTYTQNLLGSGSDIDGFGESIAENDILDEDVLGEELDYEDDELKKTSELVFSSSNADVSVDSNNSLNVTVIEANDEKPLPQRESQRHSQKGEKKVHLIRNRSLSCLSDADLKENDKLESTTDQSNNEEKGHQSSIKICTKLSVQSAEERLELRKRKFGSVREEDKKMERAARFGIINNKNSAKNLITKFPGSNVSIEVHESIDVLKQRAERFGVKVAPILEKTKTFDTLKSRAERFGAIVSPLLNKLSEEEKMQARKNRFLSNSVTDASSEEKKKRRAERFKITSR